MSILGIPTTAGCQNTIATVRDISGRLHAKQENLCMHDQHYNSKCITETKEKTSGTQDYGRYCTNTILLTESCSLVMVARTLYRFLSMG